MKSLRRFFTRFFNSAARREQEERLREEIDQHIAFQTEENIRAGLTPIEARRQAMLKFGGVEAMKLDYRAERGLPWIENLLHDIRFALRMLHKNPGFTIVAVLTLALGIGANAAIFSVVRGVLLRPLNNRDENRLLFLRQSTPGNDDISFSIPEINDLGSHLKTISELGTLSQVAFTVVGLGEAQTLNAGVVDGNYFNVMGLRPVIGRLIGPPDDGPHAAGAVVLTYHFWTTVLHSDPNILGKTVRLGSFGGLGGTRGAVVVGVVQPTVPYPVETELIANIVTSSHHLSATMVTGREHRMTEVFARLAPNADLDSARAELATAYANMNAAHPDVYKPAEHYQLNVTRMHDQINSRANTVLWVLFAASGLLFVIACSNVANLFLARTVRREPELALRSVLGATSTTLRRSLLAEAMVLCGTGLFAGVLIAAPMVSVLSRYASRFSVRAERSHSRFQLALDWRRPRVHRRDRSRFRSAFTLHRRLERLRPIQQLRAHHRRQSWSSPRLCRNPDRRVIPIACRRGRDRPHSDGARKKSATVPDRACSRRQFAGHDRRPHSRSGPRFFIARCSTASPRCRRRRARLRWRQRPMA